MLNVAVYESEKFTAYLYPKKIVVCTKKQCFRITYDIFTNKHVMDTLKIAMLDGAIKTIPDIADFCVELKWVNCGKPC